MLPQQNIHSAAVMASTRTALRRLVAPIVAWYRKLDPADRWLLAGIRIARHVPVERKIEFSARRWHGQG